VIFLSQSDKVMQTVPAADRKSYTAIEAATRSFCKKAVEKENRLVRSFLLCCATKMNDDDDDDDDDDVNLFLFFCVVLLHWGD
jgi:hypothetical protein